jgi:hypothetical protein
VGSSSIYFAVESNQGRMIGGVFILAGLLTVGLIKTCRN